MACPFSSAEGSVRQDGNQLKRHQDSGPHKQAKEIMAAREGLQAGVRQARHNAQQVRLGRGAHVRARNQACMLARCAKHETSVATPPYMCNFLPQCA